MKPSPRLVRTNGVVLVVAVLVGTWSARAAVTVGQWKPIFKGAELAAGAADAAEPRLQSSGLIVEVSAAVARFDQGLPPIPLPAAAPAATDEGDDEEAPGE